MFVPCLKIVQVATYFSDFWRCLLYKIRFLIETTNCGMLLTANSDRELHEEGEAMYAQVTKVQVPLGMRERFRGLLMQTYLPQLRKRDGFLGMMLLEETDDEDAAQIIVLWENQASVEAFARTGSLEAGISAIGAIVPGTKVVRSSFLVTAREGVITVGESMMGSGR